MFGSFHSIIKRKYVYIFCLYYKNKEKKMLDINFPSSNVSTHIKNLTGIPLYGINSVNEIFCLIPQEDCPQTSEVYVMSQEKVLGQFLPRVFGQRHYKAPMDNAPLYVEEMACVLFISEKERVDTLAIYGGNGNKLVKAHAAGIVPLINASYVAITSLTPKKYYQVSGGGIEEIPIEDGNYVKKIIRDYGIPENKMETHDIFVINTVIRKGRSKDTKETISKTKIEYVDRATIIPGNPIIFSYNGLVIFNEYQDAEFFIKNYGTIDTYMIAMGLRHTRFRQEKQIEELNKRATSDKKSMVQVFSLMGGTSVVSILTKTLLQCVEDGESGTEVFKRLLKIIGIGIIGIGGIIGSYLLYKKYIQYKEESKKKK
jgi:hypothetical protein